MSYKQLQRFHRNNSHSNIISNVNFLTALTCSAIRATSLYVTLMSNFLVPLPFYLCEFTFSIAVLHIKSCEWVYTSVDHIHQVSLTWGTSLVRTICAGTEPANKEDAYWTEPHRNLGFFRTIPDGLLLVTLTRCSRFFSFCCYHPSD